MCGREIRDVGNSWKPVFNAGWAYLQVDPGAGFSVGLVHFSEPTEQLSSGHREQQVLLVLVMLERGIMGLGGQGMGHLLMEDEADHRHAGVSPRSPHLIGLGNCVGET